MPRPSSRRRDALAHGGDGRWRINRALTPIYTYRYRDGRKYVGQFRENRRNGQGTFTLPNGAKFVGEYRDDKRNGPGTEYGPDGKLLQSGTWKDDVLVKNK